MSAAVEAIALLTPIIASNAVFAPRRISRGMEAMDDNAVYGVMNLDIAAGQTVKGARAAKALSIASNSSAWDAISALDGKILKAAEGSKVLGGALKVLDFTANNINPIICVTSGIKVLGSEDRADAAVREGAAIGTMFAAEGAAKAILGMPYMIKNKYTGKTITKTREALYKKNPFMDRQIMAFKDYCNTKKLFNKISLKPLPGIIKGTLFVTASILGYKLGSYIADKILGPQKTKENTKKST